MFRYTRLRLIGKDGDFEVCDRSTGNVVGAIIRHSGTEKEWEESGGGLPYDVFYMGKKVGETNTSPSAQKILDDIVKQKYNR